MKKLVKEKELKLSSETLRSLDLRRETHAQGKGAPV